MTSKHFLLCAVLSGAFLSPVRAQTTQNTAQKSGYELLVEAGQKVIVKRGVYDEVAPAEKLRRERASIARNAPALALMRQALRQPIAVPQRAPEKLFPRFARIRELARQLALESDVRFADGDFVGAMNSKVDAMEMGAAISHGPLIAGLVGVAMEAIGRKDAEKPAAHLSAAQCRAIEARLQAIEARRFTLAQTLRNEQSYTLYLQTGYLADMKTKKLAQIVDDEFLNAQDIKQLQTLTLEKLAQDNARFFDALVIDADKPYSNTSPQLPPVSELNPFTRTNSLWAKGSGYRFDFARPVAQNRLLRVALELRARKLEHGAYPETFQTPLDPFSPNSKPLVYRRTATSYLLYSIGPDGVDDGGKAVSERLQPTSRGDLVQAPL